MRLSLRTIFVATLSGLLTIVGSVAAYAGSPGTATMTQHADLTVSMPATNPCTGNPAVLTLSSESVLHITYFTAPGANEFWITGTDVDQFTTSPDPQTGVTYSGQGADWFGASINQSNMTSGNTFNLEGTGTDGSHVSAHFLMRITVASFGPPPVVTANFTNSSLTCR